MTYKTPNCKQAYQFHNDLWMCRDNNECNYKITTSDGKHKWCFLRLDGIREWFDANNGKENLEQRAINIKTFFERYVR